MVVVRCSGGDGEGHRVNKTAPTALVLDGTARSSVCFGTSPQPANAAASACKTVSMVDITGAPEEGVSNPRTSRRSALLSVPSMPSLRDGVARLENCVEDSLSRLRKSKSTKILGRRQDASFPRTRQDIFAPHAHPLLSNRPIHPANQSRVRRPEDQTTHRPHVDLTRRPRSSGGQESNVVSRLNARATQGKAG